MLLSSSLMGFPSCLSLFSVVLSFLCIAASGLATTDTITWGGDNSRSGYQSNHNMDPAVVSSAQFGQIFQTALPGSYGGAQEHLYSQALVYTGADGVQYVYLATTQNNIYKLDAKTGVIVLSKNLGIPFYASDFNGCVDISPFIGVTGTGVIDPATDTWYLDTKTYADQTVTGAQGVPNGRHYMHAININDFTERPNYPVGLEGIVGRNNPTRMFNGGIQHQRPALLDTGKYIYAAYGSHCVLFNFTGWIVGYEKSTGNIVERFVTEGDGIDNQIRGGGVWMSGGGLASDGLGSMFFATGNGYAYQVNDMPVSGHSPPTSLEEAAVHLAIADDGTLSPVDFFMPWEKTQLDNTDKDLGTTPLELLPSQFSCGPIKRMGVVTGKSGKTYFLNLDDLGGYQNGPNKLDSVIQMYQNENSVYSGAGVYPLEGGYVYIPVIQYPTHVFKFSCTNNVPSFTKVADSPDTNAFTLGVGHGTVTSLNDQAGTGLLWVSDVEGVNLKVYNAVPTNGNLTLIQGFNVPGVSKFSRPVFGNGRAYLGTAAGFFYGFGAPVNLPLNCSAPYDFGTANLNNATAWKNITCTATTSTTVTGVKLTGNNNFQISNMTNLPMKLTAGKPFALRAAFVPGQVGPLSSDISINTTNNVAGFSTTTPVGLKGVGQSVAPLLGVTPNVLSFDGTILGQQQGGINQTAILLNLGNSALNFSNIKYSIASETGPFVSPNMTSAGPQLGPFTFIGLPSTIAANSQTAFTINFNPASSGNFAAYLVFSSNGGSKIFDVVGTAGTYPVALLEFQSYDAVTNTTSWVPYVSGKPFSFGNVTQNSARSLKMRLTNNATSSGTRLSVTVSKPPFGAVGIIGAMNAIDLAEGTTLAPGQSKEATLFCSVPKSQINVDTYNQTTQWIMNLDDPKFSKQFIQFTCNAVTLQAQPLLANGTSLMKYAGCYQEFNPGRQLSIQIMGSDSLRAEQCVTACAAQSYVFAGLEYNRECWCGNRVPTKSVPDGNCNFACTGDPTETCGGGGLGSTPGTYISLFGDRTRFDGTQVTVSIGPWVNPGVNNFTSQGCYTEATQGRALSYTAEVKGNFTVANCMTACARFKYAGVEYSGECYCGNTLEAGSGPTADTDCNMPCRGNSSEYCGDGGRLNMYIANGALDGSITTFDYAGPTPKPQVGSYSFIGCYKESSNGRALSQSYASDTMTIESCMGAAQAGGYSLFGLQYGRECWLGNSIKGDSAISALSDCNMPCPGDSTELCGSGGRNQMYQLNSTTPASSMSGSNTLTPTSTPASVPTSTSVSTPSTTSISSTTATAVSQPTIANWTRVGCYADNVAGRSLPNGLGVIGGSQNMTIENCISAAVANGNVYAGLQYSTECWAANAVVNGGGPASDGEARCTMACSGAPKEQCGGPDRLNLWSFSPSTSTRLSSPSSTSSSTIATTSSNTAKSTSTTPSATAGPTSTSSPSASTPP